MFVVQLGVDHRREVRQPRKEQQFLILLVVRREPEVLPYPTQYVRVLHEILLDLLLLPEIDHAYAQGSTALILRHQV